MVLYGTDFRYLSIVSEVSQWVRLSTPSIYAPAHVKWSLLLIVGVHIKQNGESNLSKWDCPTCKQDQESIMSENGMDRSVTHPQK